MSKTAMLHTALAAGLMAASSAQAQTAILDYSQENEAQPREEWTGFTALGAAMLPEFDGSEDYQTIPIAAAQVNKGNYYIATRGLGVVANVIDSEHINFGPVVRYRFGRDDDVDNARISRLRELDAAIETGAFISAISRGNFHPGDNVEVSLQATQDVGGGHGGYLADIGASYFVPVRRDLRLGVNTGIQYQSDDYMQEYFTIDANNAARSGLRQYSAEGGFNSASLGGQAIYSFTPEWGLFGMVQYTRFIGDAADSPIIEDEGSANQLLGVLAVTYRF